MIIYSRVTEPVDNEPVTLTEAKIHLEYTGTLKDAYIWSLVSAARRICEGYAGLSFVTQERSVKLDRFPANSYLYLPYGPVQSVLSFTYTDDDDVVQTLVEGTDFELDIHSPVARVYPIDSTGITTWPTDAKDQLQGIEVVYQTGFDDASGEAPPPEVRISTLRVLAKLFENRGDESPASTRYMGNGILDWETQTILDNIKVVWNANID